VKTILPTTIVIYGIEFDSIKLEYRLPVEKIVKTKVALENAHKKKEITLRAPQILLVLWYVLEELFYADLLI